MTILNSTKPFGLIVYTILFQLCKEVHLPSNSVHKNPGEAINVVIRVSKNLRQYTFYAMEISFVIVFFVFFSAVIVNSSRIHEGS